MTFVKGHSGFKPKGTKHKDTLLKEERRAIFEQEVQKVFIETIHKARPEYLLDQFIGKSPDILNATVEEKQIISEKLAKIIDEHTHPRGETPTS